MHHKILLYIVFYATTGSCALAHDVWVIPDEGDQVQLVFGHPGELETYDPGQVTATVAIDRRGQRQTLATEVRDGRLRITPGADTVLIGVNYDHGIWTEDADEHLVNKPKGEVPGYLSSVHEKMHSKSLLGWSAAAGRPTGSLLEIVPLANPFTLNPGDELPVQVLYDGAPLAGAELEMLGVFDLFFTNREGKVSLPITDEAFQYVLVYHKLKLGADADADEAKLSANLTFTRAQ